MSVIDNVDRFSVRSTPSPSATTLLPLISSVPVPGTVPQPLSTPLLSVTKPVDVGMRMTGVLDDFDKLLLESDMRIVLVPFPEGM